MFWSMASTDDVPCCDTLKESLYAPVAAASTVRVNWAVPVRSVTAVMEPDSAPQLSPPETLHPDDRTMDAVMATPITGMPLALTVTSGDSSWPTRTGLAIVDETTTSVGTSLTAIVKGADTAPGTTAWAV